MKIRDIIAERWPAREYETDSAGFNDEDGHFAGDYGKFLETLGRFTDDTGAREWNEQDNADELRLFRKYSSQLYADHLTLYRGVVLKNWDYLDPGFDFRTKPVLSFGYFLSTSISREVVEEHYLDLFGGEYNVFLLFVIKPTFQTEGIAIEYYEDELNFLRDANPNLNFAWYPNDEEIILAPNSLRVVQKEQKPCPYKKGAEYWEVHLEAVK